jgi:hypothetical protein
MSSSPRRAVLENQAPGDGSGALGSDVVAALRHRPEMINQGLEFGAFRGEQGFAVQFRGQDLIFG